jgi:hypothetical protein
MSAGLRADSRPTPAPAPRILEGRTVKRSWHALLVLVVAVAPAYAQRTVGPSHIPPGHTCTPITQATADASAGARTAALLFSRETTVLALPVDPGTLRSMGAAVPVAQDVAQGTIAESAAVAASDTDPSLWAISRRPRRTLIRLQRESVGPAARVGARPNLHQHARRAVAKLLAPPVRRKHWTAEPRAGTAARARPRPHRHVAAPRCRGRYRP